MKKARPNIITESQIRSIIRRELEKSFIPESHGLIRDLTEATTQVAIDAVAAEKAVKNATEEMRSDFNIEGPGLIEKWLNKIGIVDPCDLTDRQRGKLTVERDLMQKNLDEMKKMKAVQIKNRLDKVGNAAMWGGAGSLAFFVAHNPGTSFDWLQDKARSGGIGLSDKLRDMSPEAREEFWGQCQNLLKKANSAAAGADAQTQLLTKLDAIAADPSSGVDYVELGQVDAAAVLKHGNVDLFGAELNIPQGASKEDAEAVTNYLKRIMGSMKDEDGNPVQISDPRFERLSKMHGYSVEEYNNMIADPTDHQLKLYDKDGDGKIDLKPVTYKKHQMFATGDYDPIKGQETALKPHGEGSAIDNLQFALRSAAGGIKRTDDYKEFAQIMKKPGGPKLFAAVAANMVRFWNSPEWGGMYKTPTSFMRQMHDNLNLVGTAFADDKANKGMLDTAFMRKLFANEPTAYELLYNDKGKNTYGSEVFKMVAGGEGDSVCLPPGKRFDRDSWEIVDKEYETKKLDTGMDTNLDGKVDDDDLIDTKHFVTAAKYMAILAVGIKIYNTLLGLVPGVFCTIKEFAKSVAQSASGAVSLALDAFKGIFSWIKDIFKAKKESVYPLTIKEQHEIIRRWNNTLAAVNTIENKLCA